MVKIDTVKISNFKSFSKSAKPYFNGYHCFCTDISFSMFYAWAERFKYRYISFNDATIVTGIGLENQQGFVILAHDVPALKSAITMVLALCDEMNINANFEYINERDVEVYTTIATEYHKQVHIEYDDNFSDYLYKSTEYLDISGNKNRSKRGSVNYLLSHFPNVHMEEYQSSMYPDCIEVFQQWCNNYDCQKCFYGCELDAFKRFMKVYNGINQRVYLTYDGNVPISVSVFEKITSNTLCCLFHKNAKRVRGLTYWVSQNVLLRSGCEYLNLGEDMGISGIITDKSNLHPCDKVKKYTISMFG